MKKVSSSLPMLMNKENIGKKPEELMNDPKFKKLLPKPKKVRS